MSQNQPPGGWGPPGGPPGGYPPQQGGYGPPPQQQGYAPNPYQSQQQGGYGPGYGQQMQPAGIGGWKCPMCSYQGMPQSREKISTAGWILFVVLIFLCIFLCWIPLITMKSRANACPQCGTINGTWS